jgi:hypothetical protein
VVEAMQMLRRVRLEEAMAEAELGEATALFERATGGSTERSAAP